MVLMNSLHYPQDDESNILLIVNGLERSGTIWTSRLLSDSLQVACRTRYNNPPFSNMSDDAAIWHFERPGPFIRRIHAFVRAYPYSDKVPMVLVMRDPRDVAVSLAYYRAQGNPISRDKINGTLRWLVPPWIEFYREWFADERLAGTVRYERLLADPSGEIGWLILAAGLVPDYGRIDKAVREHEYSRINNPYKGKFGRSGSWKTEIDRRVAEDVWGKYEQELLELGYDWEGIAI